MRPIVEMLCAVIGMLVLLGLAAEAPAQAKEDVYDEFNRLCIRHFGAEKEPEVYRMFGNDLKLLDGGTWKHVSETSACIAWETNLPAKTWVEYGETNTYGKKTPEPERCFFLHVHYLKELRPETTYHYRLVSVDERGRKLASPDMTFTTRKIADALRIPGDVPGPPYVLDTANKTYLVTRDIATDGTAVFIAASGITLDLGGHTITYDQKKDTTGEGACGVRSAKRGGGDLTGLTVVNGTIRRGSGGSSTQKVYDVLYSPVFLYKPRQMEMAGVTVDYDGDQVSALLWVNGGEANDFHHNVLVDRGTKLFNRHIGMDAVAPLSDRSKCHHNLIKRTRHRGMAAGPDREISSNEIYVDSYATNSYGIIYYTNRQEYRNLRLHHNRIFGTGFHPIGIGSGQGYSDVVISENYIQMQGTKFDRRWVSGQGGGDPADQRSPVNGIRLQRPRRNIEHSGNVVVVKGYGEGCEMRGLWLVPDENTGEGIVLRNNTVKLIAEDDQASGYAVACCGTPDASPVVRLEGNTFISNVQQVQCGDSYGFGRDFQFFSNTFVRTGNDPRYRTIRLGWRGWKYPTYGHLFVDSRLEGGASFDQVSFDGIRAARYDFSVGWTLDIEAPAGADVTIKDKTGAEVFSGQVPADDRLRVPLVQYVRSADGADAKTPHTVSVTRAGKTETKTVTMDSAKAVKIAP